MTERSIVEAAARLRRHGEPYLVATVVATHGTAYRRPGARMILTRFRWVAGTVTGGMLEGDISSEGWKRTKEAPILVRYDGTASQLVEDEDIRSAFGLGGDGAVEVLLERAGQMGRIDALEGAARCFRTQARGAVATVYRASASGISVGARLALVDGGEIEEEAHELDPQLREAIAGDLRSVVETGTSTNRTYVLADGDVEVLIEAITPPPRLFLFGTGHDAVPVAQLAHQIGWEVVVCAAATKHSTRERFATADEVLIGTPAELTARIDASYKAVAVVMNHDGERDLEALRMLLATKAAHVVTLGPRDRAFDPRIHVVEHGDTPQQIALAMIAQAQHVIDPAPIREAEPAPVASERPTSSRPSAMFAAIAAL